MRQLYPFCRLSGPANILDHARPPQRQHRLQAAARSSAAARAVGPLADGARATRCRSSRWGRRCPTSSISPRSPRTRRSAKTDRGMSRQIPPLRIERGRQGRERSMTPTARWLLGALALSAPAFVVLAVYVRGRRDPCRLGAPRRLRHLCLCPRAAAAAGAGRRGGAQSGRCLGRGLCRAGCGDGEPVGARAVARGRALGACLAAEARRQRDRARARRRPCSWRCPIR